MIRSTFRKARLRQLEQVEGLLGSAWTLSIGPGSAELSALIAKARETTRAEIKGLKEP